MALHEAQIAIKDEKGDISHVRFWIDQGIATLDECLTRVQNIAFNLQDATLFSGEKLITGQIVSVVLRAHGNLASLVNNPPAPAVNCDVQERLVLQMPTENGTTMRITIPTLNEEQVWGNRVNQDILENFLLDLANDSYDRAFVCNERGDRLTDGYNSQNYVDWGKRRKR